MPSVGTPLSSSEARVKRAEARPPKATSTIDLVRNPDILAEVASRADAPFCVGFAAESEQLLAHARAKLVRKGVPLIVGNLGPATFGRDDNALLLVDADTERALPADGSSADKLTLARELMRDLATRLARQGRVRAGHAAPGEPTDPPIH